MDFVFVKYTPTISGRLLYKGGEIMVNYNKIKRDSNPILFDMWLDFEMINFWLCYGHIVDTYDYVLSALNDLTKYPYM